MMKKSEFFYQEIGADSRRVTIPRGVYKLRFNLCALPITGSDSVTITCESTGYRCAAQLPGWTYGGAEYIAPLDGVVVMALQSSIAGSNSGVSFERVGDF